MNLKRIKIRLNKDVYIGRCHLDTYAFSKEEALKDAVTSIRRIIRAKQEVLLYEISADFYEDSRYGKNAKTYGYEYGEGLFDAEDLIDLISSDETSYDIVEEVDISNNAAAFLYHVYTGKLPNFNKYVNSDLQ
jgi:hypothetical protein